MSRIIEFRMSAQKAAKQSVQGKTCAFTGHRPQSLPFGFDESDKRCTSLKSVMRDQIVALIENEGVTQFYYRHGSWRRYVRCGNCTRFEIKIPSHYSGKCNPL